VTARVVHVDGPSGVGAADPAPCAVLPVFRYRNLPEHPGLSPATLFAGSCPELDRDPDRWAPVTVLGSVTGCLSSPAARDAAGWLSAFADDPAEPAATVLVPGLADSVAATVGTLEPGARLLLVTLRTVLPVEHRSREEYEAALPKRKRDRVRNERSLLRRGGRTIEVEPLTPALIGELVTLQGNTQRRHGSPFVEEQYAERLRRLAASGLADTVATFVCRHGGRAIGYVLGLVRDRVLTVYAAGLDYQRTGSSAEYFNLLVHEPVDYCLRSGLRGVDLGQGGLPQKLQRGGRPEPLWSLLVRHPPEWTAAAGRLHNRTRAALLGWRHARYLSPSLRERLGRIARTGAVDFTTTRMWWTVGTGDGPEGHASPEGDRR
jgi:hypothetical protein